MTTKQYLWALLVVSASLLGIVSCSKSEEPQAPTPTTTEEVAPEGETVEVDFAGLYDTSAPKGGLRYIGTTSESGIKITLSAAEIANPKKLRLHLVQEENPSQVTTVYVTPKITEVSTGKYRITYRGQVQLQGAGQTFASGTWYIGGIYGAENTNTTFALPNNSEYALWGNNESVTLTLPLVLGWTRLYTKAKPAPASEADTQATQTDMAPLSPDLGRNFALQYEPDGILLRVRAINGLLSPIPISHVIVETDEFSSGPAKYPAVSGVTIEKLRKGMTPSPLTATSTATKFRIEASIPADMRFTDAGAAVKKDAYIWLHETSRTYQSNTKTKIWLNANGPNTGSSDWSGIWPIEKRLLGKNPDGSLNLQDFIAYEKQNDAGRQIPSAQRGATRYRMYGGERSSALPKKSAASGHIRGHIYPVNIEVTSDVIMSELFVSRDYSDPNSNTPIATHALIEIYNPTLRDIDLTNYGLVRIFTRRERGDRVICPGVAIGQANPGDHLEKALVLPLNPTTGYSTKWNPNSLGVKPDGTKWSTNEAYIHSPQPNYDGYTIQYRDYADVFGCEALTSTSKLGPGKTMIILSSRYLKDRSVYTPNLAQDSRRMVAGEEVVEIFKQIKDAVDQGYCQYVFSANNAKDVTAIPNAVGAGVMTVGLSDFFTVVKVKRNGQRTLVDSDWLYRWGDMNRETALFNAAPSTFEGYVRKRRLPLLGNTSILFTQDYLNRTFYTVGGTNNFSTFGVSEYLEYQPTWTYDLHIQPLVDRKDRAKIH